MKASWRAARDRLADVTEAIAAINRHRARGDLDELGAAIDRLTRRIEGRG